MENKKIADVFNEMANILEIKGEGFFRVNGYRKGALAVSGLAHDLGQMVREEPDQLKGIAGIGKALQAKIVELVETGKCAAHEKMKKDFPRGLLEIMKLRGLGPKKIKLFYEELGIESLSELKSAAEKAKLRGLPKMGEKSEADVLQAIEEYEKFAKGRSLIGVAKALAHEYIDYLKGFGGVKKIEYAGSLRRRQETIGDIDILVILENEGDNVQMMDYFCSFKRVTHVLAQGETKSSVVLDTGIQVDLRVVAEESFGAALHYFTGSKEHNVAIRDMAKKRGLKVNEYGVFDGEKKVAGESEKSVFAALGLEFIPPELRQNKGEFGERPKLLEQKDLFADFRVSGAEDLKSFVKHYKNIGIRAAVLMLRSSDYGPMLEKKMREVFDDLPEGFRFLKGLDVNIGLDGSLEATKEVLSLAEVICVSVQVGGRLDADAQTKRIIKAIENPYSKVWGLPMGRILNRREQMKYDMPRIVKACVENDVAIEICGKPERLDLNDKYIRMAAEMGAKFVLSSGAVKAEEVENIEFALGMARRGWLSVDYVADEFIIEGLYS